MDVESRFYSVLNTNYIPDQAERVLVEDIILVQESEIFQLEAIIAPILQRLNSLKTSSKAHKALISQARRLPAELVAAIFLLCYVNGKPFGGSLRSHTLCISPPA
ncbi:hypothetical protein BD410DRAFT_777860 [Rickenella mellea]|uniref:Uncharacterized protein n=1 Tax=Rickenella mellea TaxID=50990 RepID=A0A4Y7PKL5_9AGAM|nr:hypothetical protein BD410DRAFT_777860 [Rickenella mellea]